MASLRRHLQMWLESVRRAWRRGEAGMNMYRMLMANSEAVEESRGDVPPLSALPTRGYRQTDHRRRRRPGLGDPGVTGGGSH